MSNLKVNNQNKEMEILTKYGFKRKTELGGGGSNVYKYYIWENPQALKTIVYNTICDNENPYYEIWDKVGVNYFEGNMDVEITLTNVVEYIKSHLEK